MTQTIVVVLSLHSHKSHLSILLFTMLRGEVCILCVCVKLISFSLKTRKYHTEYGLLSDDVCTVGWPQWQMSLQTLERVHEIDVHLFFSPFFLSSLLFYFTCCSSNNIYLSFFYFTLHDQLKISEFRLIFCCCSSFVQFFFYFWRPAIMSLIIFDSHTTVSTNNRQ